MEWYRKNGFSVTFFGNRRLKERIDELKIIREFNFILLERTAEIKTKVNLIFQGLKRNFSAVSFLKDIAGKYDVVYSVSSVLDLIIFPYLLKRADRKIIWVTVFDNIVPFSDPGNRFIRFLSWLFFKISLILLKRADWVFVISPELKYFLTGRGFKEESIVVTGNAVEGELIRQAKKDGARNIDALFVGRINETKGIFDMLKVLDIVKTKYPDFQLAVMGGGDARTEQRFRNKIKALALEKNVQFLGYKSGIEKFNIIKSSKCFWFLSVSASESFGVALLEAVCCGLPAFVYDLLPYRNIYKNNEVFVFKKNDYEAVAQGVIKLFAGSVFENKRGALLADKYSWERIADIEFNSFNTNLNGHS
jgi:glycosyltransferase involved in cell wall biosynthesis